MRRIFRFIIREEAPSVTDSSSRLDHFLRDAHRLKRAMQQDCPNSETSKATDALTTAEAEAHTALPSPACPAAGKGDDTKRQKIEDCGRKAEPKKQRVESISLEEACALITKHRFSREHVGDTRLLKEAAVWQALLGVGMPFTALTRNLGRLTSLAMFDGSNAGAANLAVAVKQFKDKASLRAARAHPIVLLSAIRVYASGHGDRGSLQWDAHPEMVEALEEGFYTSFCNVQPTGKRFLVGIDVSLSMDFGS